MNEKRSTLTVDKRTTGGSTLYAMEDITTNIDEDVEERHHCESNFLQSSPTQPSQSQLLSSSQLDDSSWWRENWNFLELSGSFGTLIPLLVALGKQRAIYLVPTLWGTGVWHIICGLIWDTPMPLQPMKAIASLAIASELNRLEVTIAGVGMGVCFLLFGIFGGAIETMHRLIPNTVIGGLQLGVGWKLAMKGIQMIDQLGWIENPYDSKFWSIFSGFVCLYFLRVQQANHHGHDTTMVGCWQKFRKQFPVGLSLFLLGILLATMNFVNSQHTSTGANGTFNDLVHVDSSTSTTSEPFFVNALKGSTWEHWRKGFLEGTLPQLPLTTLNSCLSVCVLAKNLFPDKPEVERRSICWSIGLMNLTLCSIGGFPHCHGAGGLAAQYKFGAKSGLSMIILGAFKVAVGLWAATAENFLALLDAFPLSILGLLLVLAGHELALTGVSSVARSPGGSSVPGNKRDLTVTLMTGLLIVGTGETHVGTFCGLVTHLLHESPESQDLERRRFRNSEEAENDVDQPIEHGRSEEYSPLHYD